LKIKFTQELKEIVESNSSFISVLAFAGSGKTTTLVEFAKYRPNSKILYLAFNSSIAQHAKNIFPKNVTVSTAHSLAHKSFGKYLTHKYNKKIMINQMLSLFGLDNTKKNIILSKEVLNVIKEYCESSYLTINDSISITKKYPVNRSVLLNYSKILWKEMTNIESKFPSTHDVYLKLYQLSSPKINYDYILFDEAQDSNPVISDIILSQRLRNKKIKLVFVGDHHQAIYTFRGATNTLNKIKPTKTLYLTKSFRFGNEIAGVLNTLLKVMKQEPIEITGNENVKDDVSGVDFNKQFALLSRTNSHLFLKACELVERNKKIYFIGGRKSYNFFKIYDVENLYNLKKSLIKDKHIKSFKDFNELMEHSKLIDDKEMLYLGKIIEKYGDELSEVLEKLKDLEVCNKKDADVLLSTVHKSKGLEFDQVYLCNDFTDFINKEGDISNKQLNTDEINIVYVAASRAINRLQMNITLKNIINYYNNNKKLVDNLILPIKEKKISIKSNPKITFKNKFNKKNEND
jgi:superfamily I DNA/RNA helicase